MKKLLAVAALSALVAGPSYAAGSARPRQPTEAQKERADKSHENADKNVAAADQKRAHDLYVSAGNEDKSAVDHHKKAEVAWHNWQNELHAMYQARANAGRMRNQAALLNRTAAKLIQAEHLRGQALDDRLAADQLYRSAHNHELQANAAQNTINEGQKALKDLGNNPALANAIKDINADIAAQQQKQKDESGKAKADRDIAAKLLATAADKERQAAGLERPPVPPPVFKPAPQKPAPAVVAKAPPVSAPAKGSKGSR